MTRHSVKLTLGYHNRQLTFLRLEIWLCTSSSPLANIKSQEHGLFRKERLTHHDHNIKLLRLRDKLHRSIVDNHGIKLDSGVTVLLLCDSLARVEEETVSEFHNVGFVHAGDFL